MPVTKRAKKQKTSATKKKTPEHKEALVKKIHQGLKAYQKAIVFEFNNLTTSPFKELQQAWKPDSKFFLGKNKVMQIALGKSEEDSKKKNTYLLSNQLKGQRGLLLTNKTVDEMKTYLANFNIPEFARAGHIAQQQVVLKKGVDSLKQFAHSIEPHLRKLGLNTSLMNQQIILNDDYSVCQVGKPITVEQSKLLRLLDIKLAQLEIKPICILNLKNGSFNKAA